MSPSDDQSSVPADLLFTGFVHGRCILEVETVAWKLHGNISNLDLDSYDPFLDSERFLDRIDDLRIRYKVHLNHVVELLPGEDIAEYRAAVGRIEAIFDDCREKLMMLKSDTVPAWNEKTIQTIEVVPEFSGKVSDWAKFQMVFRNLVLESCELSETEKLEAFNLKVSSDLRNSLTCSSTSTDTLWKALCAKFQPNAVSYHVTELFAEKNVSKWMTSEELTALVQASEKHVEALGYLGYATNPFANLILGHLLKRQTSTEFRSDFEKLDRLPTWNSIKSTLLKSAITRKCQAHLPLLSADTRCFYCRNAHILRFCDTFRKLPFEKRFEVVVKFARICHICFSSKHLGKRCNTMVSCQKCGGTHNTALHPEDDNEKNISLLDKLMD